MTGGFAHAGARAAKWVTTGEYREYCLAGRLGTICLGGFLSRPGNKKGE